MRKKSITNKLILNSLILTVVSLMTLGYFIFFMVNSKTKEEHVNFINNQLVSVDKNISNYVDNIIYNVNMLTSLPLLKKADSRVTTYADKKGENGLIPMTPLENNEYEADIYRLFQSFVEANPSVFTASLGVEEHGGFVQFPARPRSDGYDARARSWYKAGKSKADSVTFSNAYTTSTNDLVIYVVKGIKDESNNFRGILSVDINLDNLNEINEDMKIRRNRLYDFS